MEGFIEFLTSLSVFDIVKIFVLILLSLYLLFAFVLLNQISMMGKIVKAPLTPILKVFAFFHLLGSIALLLLSFIIL